MENIVKPSLSVKLATEWLALDPAAAWTCFGCGQEVRLASLPFPVMGCPHCNFLWSDGLCQAGLDGLDDRRRRMAEEQAAAVAASEAPAPDAARCDPPGLDDVIGNAAAVMQIRTALDAHRKRKASGDKRAFPHIVMTGPAGLGKTALSNILSRELKARMHLQMGQSMNSPAKVCEVLQELKAGDILFIDEIHGMLNKNQEALYLAMEDSLIIPPTRAGRAASESKPIRLPPFTIIGATTDEWGILPPLLRRFKYRVRLTRLGPEELAKAMSQRAKKKGLDLSDDAASLIGARAMGRPGAAVNLLDICHDAALAQGTDSITSGIVDLACAIWKIDRMGLDQDAIQYLTFLGDAGGDPVRLNVLSSKMEGLSKRTVETRIEPDLVYLGLITKQENGRVLTEAGKRHIKNES